MSKNTTQNLPSRRRRCSRKGKKLRGCTTSVHHQRDHELHHIVGFVFGGTDEFSGGNERKNDEIEAI